MTQNKIKRLNELARKSKITELSAKEKEEQTKLMQEYINNVKSNFVKSMENIVIVDKDGNKRPVKRITKNLDSLQ